MKANGAGSSGVCNTLGEGSWRGDTPERPFERPRRCAKAAHSSARLRALLRCCAWRVCVAAKNHVTGTYVATGSATLLRAPPWSALDRALAEALCRFNREL